MGARGEGEGDAELVKLCSQDPACRRSMISTHSAGAMRPRHSRDFKKEEKAVGWMSQERLIVKIYGVCFVCVCQALS